ncbi:MAG: orotate phosphoribosyltransferase, partial [Chitinophagaceae bacterium]|nr:orotate phosphoribosyltransferase [Chitinophagaceae bacterium]
GNQIEGVLTAGQKVVVIEDLIITGKSSMEDIEAIRNAGGDILGLVSVFTYQFNIAKDLFEKENIPTYSLSNYSALIEIALQKNIISENEMALLQDWRENPSEWGR